MGEPCSWPATVPGEGCKLVDAAGVDTSTRPKWKRTPQTMPALFPLVNSVSAWQRPRMAETEKRIAAIKRAMKRTKVGNNELARRAGVAKSTVSRILKGERSPSAKILFALESVALKALEVIA
jgi:DNA-binding XRE family transcriptional regulator